jgi:hypothetical protein
MKPEKPAFSLNAEPPGLILFPSLGILTETLKEEGICHAR